MPDEHGDTFSIATRRGRAPVIHVEGQLDLHTASELRSHFDNAIDSGERQLVVDLSATTFLDSMALGTILGAHKRLQERAGRLVVACPVPHLRRVFEITALDRALDVADSYPEAIARLDAGTQNAV